MMRRVNSAMRPSNHCLGCSFPGGCHAAISREVITSPNSTRPRLLNQLCHTRDASLSGFQLLSERLCFEYDSSVGTVIGYSDRALK